MTKSARNRKTSKSSVPVPEQQSKQPTPSAEEQAPGTEPLQPIEAVPQAETSPETTTDPKEPEYMRRIELRLALPQPHVRYENGKPVRGPGVDPERLIRAIRSDLLRLTDEHYGPQTELVITTAGSPSIRLTGNFGVKASAVQGKVQGWLDEVFEYLDLSE